MRFAEAIAKAVRGHDEKDFPGSVSVFVNAESRLFFFQATRLQFREGGFYVVHLEETSFLRRVASVFGQADLDAVSRENTRLMRRVLSCHDAEPEHIFIVWNCLINILNREVHSIVGIRRCGLK